MPFSEKGYSENFTIDILAETCCDGTLWREVGKGVGAKPVRNKNLSQNQINILSLFFNCGSKSYVAFFNEVHFFQYEANIPETA